MKKIFYFMFVALLAGVVASCSKDDEPSDYTPTYDGVSIYLNAIEAFYNNDGDPKYVATESPGTYIAYADNAEYARQFIMELLENDKWDGKNITVGLGENGESGSLKIITSGLPEGFFYEVDVDIKDYTPYTLQIVTEERFKNENSEGYSGGGVARLQSPGN